METPPSEAERPALSESTVPPLPSPDTPPDGFGHAFEEELLDVATRRQRAFVTPPGAPLKPNLVGLALSGGGIRSATVCLGVLQALHKSKLLPMFDYLSTVSGGGFTGGWWSAYLARPEPGADRPREEILFPPDEDIEPDRSGEYLKVREDQRMAESAVNAARDPIHHLRLFANYLTPRKGVLSADTWWTATIVMRNLVLTWLILLPLLFAAVMSGRLVYLMQPDTALDQDTWPRSLPVTKEVKEQRGPHAAKWQAFIRNRPASEEADRVEFKRLRAESSDARWLERGQRAVFGATVPIALLAWAVIGTLAWLWLLPYGRTKRDRVTAKAGLIGAVVVAGLFVALIVIVWTAPRTGGQSAAAPTTAAAPLPATAPALQVSVWTWKLGAFCFAWFVLSGIALAWVHRRHVKAIHDAEGPWRFEVWRNSILHLHSSAFKWSAAAGGMMLLAGFGHDIVGELLFLGGDWVRATGWAGVIATIGGTIFTWLRASPSGGGDRRERGEPGSLSKLVFMVTPILALIALALTAAWLGHRLLERLVPQARSIGVIVVLMLINFVSLAICWLFSRYERLTGAAGQRKATGYALFALAVLPTVLAIFAATSHASTDNITDNRAWAAFFVLEICVLTITWVVALGWMADPNALSMHLFYKSRLVRAYMGASNAVRQTGGQEITESAEKDDVRLTALRNTDRGGPYHLVNTTLNLTGGRDLTTAQRHAAYFVLSKRYCGSLRTGYRKTEHYMSGRMSLGTAVAVSGAAASPNMGSNTPTAAVAMLMTLMNVRLGYWLPTPNRHQWQVPQPRLWPFHTLREFLSQTNDLASFCYLTDGGHFDNTALYSIVQRGCKYIVLIDCGADPVPCFSDIGNAIRRCRIDFGAEIDLHIESFLPNEKKLAQDHVIVGTVRYSRDHLQSLGRGDEMDTDGTLIWFKPTLTSDEPADVRQYAIENTVFPQQTTADQWFDEAQFESYRRLGEHTVTNALGVLNAVRDVQTRELAPGDIPKVFDEAKVRYPGMIALLSDRPVSGDGNGDSRVLTAARTTPSTALTDRNDLP